MSSDPTRDVECGPPDGSQAVPPTEVVVAKQPVLDVSVNTHSASLEYRADWADTILLPDPPLSAMKVPSSAGNDFNRFCIDLVAWLAPSMAAYTVRGNDRFEFSRSQLDVVFQAVGQQSGEDRFPCPASMCWAPRRDGGGWMTMRFHPDTSDELSFLVTPTTGYFVSRDHTYSTEVDYRSVSSSL
jgi:hypothetical protein